MKEKFNIAIIGVGMWGSTHVDFFQKDRRAKVLWVCDSIDERMKAAQTKFKVPKATKDYQKILADPEVDAVVVASPPYTHARYDIEVMQAGKHLIAEKPMTTNLEDAMRVVEEAKKHPELVILEGSARHARLNPKFEFVKSLIRQGKLGQVYYIHHVALNQGTFIEYNPKGIWSMTKALAGGGPYLDWGVYDLSFHLGILDDKPELVSLRSFTITGLRDLSDKVPVVDVEMHGATYMEFTEGLTYYFERGSGVHGELPNSTRIYGTKGGLAFRYTTWEPNTIEYFYSEKEPKKEVLKVDMSAAPRHDHAAFVTHFLDCLQGKAKPMMTVDLAAKHLKILFRILKDGS